MKRAAFLILFVTLFVIPTQAQTKPIKKPIAKPTPQKEITIEKAITENGKSVILKSNGMWEFAPVEVAVRPKIEPCLLTLKDAPIIRGLRLGMTRDEIQLAFGVSQKDERSPFYYQGANILPNGVAHYTFYDTTLKKLDGFRGISVLELGFYGFDKVHLIEARYSESTVDFTDEQFKMKLSESFKLPVDGWSDTSFYDNGRKILKGKKLHCAEFEIEISFGRTLTLTNLITSQKIEDNEKMKRETFKP